MVKTLLLTDSDMDGLGSAVLAKAFKINYDDIKFTIPIKMNNEKTLNLVKSFDKITITDLSFNEEFMEKLKEKDITVYDHHITSSYLNNHNKYPGSISDSSRCGTKLYFDEVIIKQYHKQVNKSAIKFVELVDTYDRWQQQSPLWDDACKLNRIYLYYRNYPSEFINYYAERIKNNDFEFNDEDEEKSNIILEEIKNAYEFSKTNMKIYENDDGKYGVSYYIKYCSEVGNDLIKNYNLTHIILIDNMKHVQVSMRSIKEFDCTKFKGINGHKNAAGGRFTTDYLDSVYNGEMMELK